MTIRECDTMLENVVDTLLQTPDDVRDQHPECRWSDVDRIKINEALARTQDIRAALRGKVTVPEYLKKYERRYIYDNGKCVRKR